MHPFYNTYGNGGNVEHLYEDNWVAPPSNTPMKDIEGISAKLMFSCAKKLNRFSYKFMSISSLLISNRILKL